MTPIQPMLDTASKAFGARCYLATYVDGHRFTLEVRDIHGTKLLDATDPDHDIAVRMLLAKAMTVYRAKRISRELRVCRTPEELEDGLRDSLEFFALPGVGR